ncbi:MAB_1171c family putative transporter [Wenjunlia tyrosinilytica]|uniref:DUF6545 domain-containing protein n=1 Tax=Wenjunlia tyrosinilytica TaxID=1544741 RepID=A0A917ZQU7_9ACTN|nr:MAB_1171c family putative transporter [Wenjunlia tyrosinilytica]GGO88023.1 hypothetical protein GCM10012280_27860 [Wenjunlia tyrosinilytica]
MFDVLYLAFAAVAWVIAAYKARAWLRGRRNADLGLVCLMTVGVATVFLFSAPSVYIRFDELVGVSNLGMVVIYSAVVVFAAGALLLLFLRWTGRESHEAQARVRARSRLLLGLIAATWTVAVVCFVLGRPDDVEHPRDLSTAYASSPGVVTFLVLYLMIFGAGTAILGSMCGRYAQTLGGSWMARGLRAVCAGCWLALLYCVCKLAGFAGTWAGRDMYWVSNGIAPISASIAALLVVGGFALPAMAPRAAAWRRLRHLRALWRTVTADAPEVTMEQPRWSRWWPLADLEWQANRQMAEIRDVQRQIRRHVDASVIDIARERGRAEALDDRDAAALVEAAALRRGLRNKELGYVPADGAQSVVMTTGTGLEEEHAHLVRVAEMYHLPLVDSVLVAVQEYSAT